MNMNLDDQFGEVAYNAYCNTRDWKSFKGEPLPRWNDQSDELKEGWIAAARAVVKMSNKGREIRFDEANKMVMEVTTMDADDRPEYPSTVDIDEWAEYMDTCGGDLDYIAAGLMEFKRLLLEDAKKKAKK